MDQIESWEDVLIGTKVPVTKRVWTYTLYITPVGSDEDISEQAFSSYAEARAAIPWGAEDVTEVRGSEVHRFEGLDYTLRSDSERVTEWV